ncbi:MAG: energy-coupling factor ABC transporter substrate-binding protein [Clostridiales bacterium]|jgi:cobalt/nickel transport protein|nr:energy-coupling factor ABC transporter substrate-binding protein [Clostridiales bacterium]
MRRYKNAFLLLIVVLLMTAPLFLLPDAEFEGADDLAGEAISEINPAYEPWLEPFWEPGSEEMERLLFAVQAVLGCAFIGYYIRVKKKDVLRPE